MLQLSATLINKPVLSLRTSAPVASVEAVLINPNNLKIEGFYCNDRFSDQRLILLSQDIRELNPKGYVVNDHEVLSAPAELVRLKDVIRINYQLLNKPVYTVSKSKVGKISDYAVEIETMFIQKLYVNQSLIKSFTGGTLSVDRSQIQEVTDRRIIISDLLKTSPVTAAAGIA
jgi:sporulation protein YlmC with PRC-barrel domain